MGLVLECLSCKSQEDRHVYVYYAHTPRDKDCPVTKAVTCSFCHSFSFLPMQTSPVFHSTSLCSGNHRFGGLEMVSSQNSEEREKETSPRMHPEAFRLSGSQSPDSRLVSDVAPPWHAEVVGRGFQAPPGVGLTPVTRQPGHRCRAHFASLAKSGRGQRCQWPERFRVGGGCGGTSGVSDIPPALQGASVRALLVGFPRAEQVCLLLFSGVSGTPRSSAAFLAPSCFLVLLN